jgi:glycine/D-amino acid oxidase-like deaminating enzyme
MPVSFWMSRVSLLPRPRLDGDLDVDVCILGAGYTGLWSAYYLAAADPGLRIAVVEREHVGFGASGRNGGWAAAELAGMDRMLADPETRPGMVRTFRQMTRVVAELGEVVAGEGIDCGYARGGTVVAATRGHHVPYLQHSVAIARDAGIGEEDVAWLGAAEAGEHVTPSRLFGALYTPHCAAVDPARLVLGLAGAVERRGVKIYEQTPGTPVPGGVRTPYGTVRATWVVQAVEAYRAALPGQRRRVIPVYSLMVMTEPLAAEVWARLGLARRQTFSDGRHLIIYGQRTADDRMAFGGRGAPYHFGSSILRLRPRCPHCLDSQDSHRPVSGPGRGCHRGGVGRPAGDFPGLAPGDNRGGRPHHRRGLRRQWGRRGAPRRQDRARSDPGRRHRTDPPPLGGASGPALGAGTTALGRRQPAADSPSRSTDPKTPGSARESATPSSAAYPSDRHQL